MPDGLACHNGEYLSESVVFLLKLKSRIRRKYRLSYSQMFVDLPIGPPHVDKWLQPLNLLNTF